MLFMCSGARRCRAQCDVLFIPQLVAILPHICLSHFCASSSSEDGVPVFVFTLLLLLVQTKTGALKTSYPSLFWNLLGVP